VAGKLKRIAIGPFPEYSLEEARNKGLALLSDLAKGIDPRQAAKPQRRAKVIPLHQACEDYFAIRKKLRPRTIEQMRYAFEKYLKPWRDHHILDITAEMILGGTGSSPRTTAPPRPT